MSRYVLKIEAIGDNYAAQLRRYSRSKAPFTYRELSAYRLGGPHLKPWVAKLTGTNGASFDRLFLRGQKDYAEANGTGSRGIWLYYFLEPGLYEVNERKNWKRVERYFAWIVDGVTLCKLSREEAIGWLRVNVR